jgi:hypothetical protein
MMLRSLSLFLVCLTFASYANATPTCPRPSLLEAGSWYCPSSDTVYVSHALLDYTWLGRAWAG